MRLSWLQPMYSFLANGDVQCCDGEHILDSGNGNHITIVIEPCIAIAIFC